MAKKANPTVIGAFVIGAVALVVTGILVFGGGKFFTPTSRFVLFFEGSVKGLNVGSPVVFRGVRIGEVTDVGLQLHTKDLSFRIPVMIEVTEGKFEEVGPDLKISHVDLGQELLERGLRAQLQLQSLVTGQLMVELDMHPDAPMNLVGVDMGVKELPTIPTKFQEITRALEQIPLDEIAQRIANAAEGLEDFLGSEEARGGMNDLRETLASARSLMDELASSVGPVTTNLQKTLTDAQALLNNLDGQVDVIGSGADQALQNTNRLVLNVDRRVGTLATNLDATVQDTRTLVKNVDAQVDPLSSGLQGTVQDTRQLVGNVDDAALRIVARIDELLKDAQATLGRAESTLTGLESAMADDSVLQYELTKTLNEVSGAARMVRVLAEFLQQRPDALLRGKASLGGR